MMIHGGGWIPQARTTCFGLPYLQLGFAVVNVGTHGRGRASACGVEDCLCALHWIGRNAKKYHFDAVSW
jgi:hypothetical protein